MPGTTSTVRVAEEQQRPAETTEYETWFRNQTEQARRSARAGLLIAADDVEVAFSARRARAVEELVRKGTRT